MNEPTLRIVIGTAGSGKSTIARRLARQYAAAYLDSRLRGASPEAAARAGHALAGVVVGFPGAIMPRDAIARPSAARPTGD